MNNSLNKVLYASSFLSILLIVTACDPVTLAIGGTVAVGAEATRNQNGVGGAVSDSGLQAQINQFLFKNDRDIFDRVELSVKHGMIVVIGYMASEEQRSRAVMLVKKAAPMHPVYDETTIGDLPKAKDLANDSGITSRIKSAMLFDGNIQSLNYDITTVKGVVYICGTAQTKYERDLVINCARNTSGVERVVAYIRINREAK